MLVHGFPETWWVFHKLIPLLSEHHRVFAPDLRGFGGAELALLLLGGFQSMVDDVHGELAHRGHPGVRASHEFALRAIDEGADTASELGRRLSVSKQGAARTIAALEKLGYVEREPDSSDGRLKRLRVTDRGHDMMTLGASLFDDVRERWAAQMGPERLGAFEAHLARLWRGGPRALRPRHGSTRISARTPEEPAVYF